MASPRYSDQELERRYSRRPAVGIPLFEPYEFGYHCPCGHTHLTWSEFQDHLWCYTCEKDYHYAEDCYLVRPERMPDTAWEQFLKSLRKRPPIRSAAEERR